VKKRPVSHLIDASGTERLKQNLPAEWVLRQYQPDYGIDFDVEVFDYDGTDLVSLGEHFFVQLKSAARFKSKTKEVFGRYNIEKTPLAENKEDKAEISVVSFPLKVSDLELARSMGPALPILLVLCDTTTGDAFFLCLNDYVDKIVIPLHQSLPTSQSLTIHVPTWNRISRATPDVIPLRFFARRAKLYAAFNRFRYQNNEMQYLLAQMEHAPPDDLRSGSSVGTISVFLELVKGYDFWQTTYAWPAIELMWMEVLAFESRFLRFKRGEDPATIFGPALRKASLSEASLGELATFMLLSDIRSTWSGLANLGNMFEEICREWYLPTRLGALVEQHAFRD